MFSGLEHNAKMSNIQMLKETPCTWYSCAVCMAAARLSHVWFSDIFIVLCTSNWTYYISLKSAYIEDYSYGHERSTGGCFGTLYNHIFHEHGNVHRAQAVDIFGHVAPMGLIPRYTREQLIALRGVRTLTNDVIAAAHPLRRQRGRFFVWLRYRNCLNYINYITCRANSRCCQISIPIWISSWSFAHLVLRVTFCSRNFLICTASAAKLCQILCMVLWRL